MTKNITTLNNDLRNRNNNKSIMMGSRELLNFGKILAIYTTFRDNNEILLASPAK